jgi:hypothetical protein
MGVTGGYLPTIGRALLTDGGNSSPPTLHLHRKSEQQPGKRASASQCRRAAASVNAIAAGSNIDPRSRYSSRKFGYDCINCSNFRQSPLQTDMRPSRHSKRWRQKVLAGSLGWQPQQP